MPPVIDRVPGVIMGSIDDALMFAYDLPLGDNQEAIGINAQADGPIGEGRRHAVAVAFQMHEAGRRDPFAIFDEAIERPAHGTAAGPAPRSRRNTGTARNGGAGCRADVASRSEEHTSELQSIMRSSYAGMCLNKNKKTKCE